MLQAVRNWWRDVPWAADPWFGWDKLEHWVWCYAGTLTLLFLLPWWMVLLVVVLAAVLVELVQWLRLENTLLPAEFADGPSYRDLAWDAVGLIWGALFWVLVQ